MGREALQSGIAWRQVRAEFFATGNAAAVANALTQAVDVVVKDAYESSIAPHLPAAVMLAVGGFGRSELFPYSDVDIVIVRQAESPLPPLQEALARFVQLLWDNGLRPNQRVCTIEECLEFREQGIDFQFNLLDRRWLS